MAIYAYSDGLPSTCECEIIATRRAIPTQVYQLLTNQNVRSCYQLEYDNGVNVTDFYHLDGRWLKLIPIGMFRYRLKDIKEVDTVT